MMSEYPLRDRAFRFDLAARLWDELRDKITPALVSFLAEELDDALNGTDPPEETLAIINQVISAHGFAGVEINQVAALALMALHDRHVARWGISFLGTAIVVGFGGPRSITAG